MNLQARLFRVGSYVTIFAIFMAAVLPVPAAASTALEVSPPVINEFSASTTGTDVEYVELLGDPEADYSAYTVLEIEGDGSGAGTIDEVIGMGTTDGDGFYLANLAANTLENGTLSLLLVDGFTGTLGEDLDTDNDGTFDATPWSDLVDSVAVSDGGAGDQTYGSPTLGPNYDGVSSFAPGGASRIPDGNDTNSASDWVRNDFDLAGIPGEAGTPVVGEAFNTPGAPNQVVTPTPVAPPVINEFSASTTGTDVEYVELLGDPEADYSAYTVLEIEGDGSGAGRIDEVIGMGTTDGDGFYLANLAANTLENGTLSLLLVDGFTGTLGEDLDTDNDGTFDATPWSDLVDSVAVGDGGAGDQTYGSPTLGPNYDGVSSFAPGGASRIPDGNDTNSASDWVRNDFDLAGIPGEVGTPVVGEAFNTPGAPNQVVTPTPTTPLVINEFSASTTGPDVEYVELYGEPDTDYSAYTVLEVEGDTTGAGTIDEVIPVGTTDANGFWLENLPANTLENGTLSLLLVKDFSGAYGDDLDPANDGSLGATPWSDLTDSVAVNDGGSGDYTYGVPTLTAYYDGLPYAPGGASRIPDGNDTDSASDWVRNDFDLAGIPGHSGSIILGEAYNTPGAPNEIYVPPPEACGDTFTPIYDVQGSGTASPLVGTEVAVEGVVVGDFQNGAAGEDGDLNGFYIQDLVGDGNPATSDGVFVYAPGGMDVSDGDGVRVRGNVSEYHGLTEIGASQIWQCSTDNSVAPTELALPVSGPDEFEAYEGMLVTFPQPLVISEYYNYDRFGEVVLTSERHLTPTAELEPGPAAIQAAQEILLDRITLDDGLSSQNPNTVRHPDGTPFTLDHRFRGGDILTNVTGVMDSFDAYRIQPTQGADYTVANPRPASPESVGGDLKVASFNVLNYFTTIDTGAWICGPSGDMECRGADNETELTRQRDKILAAINAMDADVVGLIEIQNDDDTSVANLVSGLNTLIGDAVYDYVPTGFIGTDAIKLAIIYKTASVTPAGSYAILDSSVDPRFIDTKNRPALAQTFMDNTTGGVFTLAVNHLKSKGSDCNDVGDPDLGDGAGNCNLTRTHAAEALVDWLAGDPTGSGSPNYLIMGDLNSYDHETPIDAIKAGPDGLEGTEDDYTDLVFHSLGENAYSYVFDGQIGYLDSALASAAMMPRTTGATIWHINADEPDILDYDTTYKSATQDALYAPDPYRSSDHDPVIVGVNVCEMVPPTLSLSVSPDSLWPANHKLTSVTVTPALSDNFDPNPTLALVSVTSNEPDEGLGDGDTANDIQFIDDLHILLRAERSGTGDGRIYTLTYQAMDACGNTTVSTIDVSVPKSQGKKK